MKINKIKLENIRSYSNQEIVFPDGSTILSGDIGCGKTSVLLAIEFALFGLQPGQKGSALLRNGTDEGKVILELEIEGSKVLIERRLKKSKTISQSFASIDGQERSVTEIKNKVLEILNYPKEFAKKTNLLYRFTVYTPQEEMKQIILENAETRLDTLRHIFGIDKYKRIRENTDLITSKLRENIRNLEGQIRDLEELKRKQEEKRISVNEISEKLIILKNELRQRKKERENLDVEIKEIEEKIKEKQNFEREMEKTKVMLIGKKENISNLEKEKSKIEFQISEIKSYISSQNPEKMQEDILVLKKELKTAKECQLSSELILKELDSKIKDKQKFEQEAETLKLKIKIKNSAMSDLQKEKEKYLSYIAEFNKVQFNPEDIGQIEKNIKLFDVALEQKNRAYLELLSKINNADSKINEILSSKKDISQLINCPTCFQEVPEEYKSNVLRKFEENILKLKKDIAVLSAEKESCLKEVDAIKTSLSNIKKELSEKEKLKIKMEDVAEKKKRIEELQKQESIFIRDIEESNKKIESLIQSSMLLGKCELEHEGKKKEYQALLSLEREKESAISSLQREIDKQSNQKMNVIEKEQSIIEIINKIKEINLDISLLETRASKLEESIFSLKRYDLLFEQKKRELNLSQQKEKQKEIEIASSEKEIEVTIKIIDDLKKEIDKKEKIKIKLLKSQEFEDWLSNGFTQMISFTERNIMLKLREEFSKLFNEWFNILVPENFAVRLDEDFTPIIEQQDFSLDYSFLSGGERTAIALAYRLALNQVINSLLSKIKTKSIVILDEPTDGFSEQQLDKMRDVLNQLKAEQLIIVSHESKIESFVDNIIKFTKEDGLTKVSSNFSKAL
jgi:exonuclease SbcC